MQADGALPRSASESRGPGRDRNSSRLADAKRGVGGDTRGEGSRSLPAGRHTRPKRGRNHFRTERPACLAVVIGTLRPAGRLAAAPRPHGMRADKSAKSAPPRPHSRSRPGQWAGKEAKGRTSSPVTAA